MIYKGVGFEGLRRYKPYNPHSWVEKGFYRLGTKSRRMTLIIGARFKDGIILVSDRKITETSTGKFSYENKLKQPLNTALVFGAAGYSHKFKQFNRKILDVINQRIREYKLMNIAHFEKLGLKYVEQEQPKVESEKLNTKEIENKDTESTQKKDIHFRRP